MLVENLFPPIPSELIMPLAGFLAAEGELAVTGVLIAGTAGSLSGAVVLYWLGRKVGYARLRSLVCKYGKFFFLSGRDLDKALAFFDRHGNSAIFLSRLIPGVRSLISLPAGFDRMALGPFLLFSLAGTLVWNVLLVGAGYLLGSGWQRVLGLLETYETVIYIAFAGLLGWLIWRRLRSGPAASDC
jgi:membrane protein DedA with SNARE-associated domain